jgi:hypothetical protein
MKLPVKLELVTSTQLDAEVDKTRKAVALASEQTHASALVINDGLGKLAVGLVVLGFALVLSGLLTSSANRGTDGALDR